MLKKEKINNDSCKNEILEELIQFLLENERINNITKAGRTIKIIK